MSKEIQDKIQEICTNLDCEAWTYLNEQGKLEVKIGWSADNPLGGTVTGFTGVFDSEATDEEICRYLSMMSRWLKEKKEAVLAAAK
jgi:hypothetical protein